MPASEGSFFQVGGEKMQGALHLLYYNLKNKYISSELTMKIHLKNKHLQLKQ